MAAEGVIRGEVGRGLSLNVLLGWRDGVMDVAEIDEFEVVKEFINLNEMFLGRIIGKRKPSEMW